MSFVRWVRRLTCPGERAGMPSADRWRKSVPPPPRLKPNTGFVVPLPPCDTGSSFHSAWGCPRRVRLRFYLSHPACDRPRTRRRGLVPRRLVRPEFFPSAVAEIILQDVRREA